MSVISGLQSRLYRRTPRLAQMVETFREKNVPFMAGSVAFTAFLSLLPLLLLVYLVVAVFGEGEVAAKVIEVTSAFLPPQGQELLARSLRDTESPTSGSIIGAVVLIWGALRLFISLDTAFNEIYAATPEESILDKLIDSSIALVSLFVALLAAVFAGVVFAVFQWVPFIGLLAPLLLVAGLVVAFLPIYYSFPDVRTTLWTALPGAIVAAVGWAVLEGLFQVYVAFGPSGESGLLGGVLILLTWLYFGALIVLVGAVVNSVLAAEAAAATVGRVGAGTSDSDPT